MPDSRVLLIYTGGTIGSVHADREDPDSRLVPGSYLQIRDTLMVALRAFEKRHKIQWDIELPDDAFVPVDSSNIGPLQWRAIAHCIERNYSEYSGFVVLHGTDTLAYSASALSFMLKKLTKPVVITGSQLPLEDDRTDGRVNVANAILIAGGYEIDAEKYLRIPRVMVCFGPILLQGNRTRKMRTNSLTGFESPNFPPLAELGEHIEFAPGLSDSVREELGDDDKFWVADGLSSDVVDVVVFPGIQATQLRKILLDRSVAGAVIRTFGAGNVPTDRDLLSVFKEATDGGAILVNVTQCPYGSVDMGLYDTGAALLQAGVISGLDITPEAALTKLQWVLAGPTVKFATAPVVNRKDVAGARSMMLTSLAGEQSSSIDEVALSVQTTQNPNSWLLAAPKQQYAVYSRALLRLDGVEHSNGGETILKVYAPEDKEAFAVRPYKAGDNLSTLIFDVVNKVNQDHDWLPQFLVESDGGVTAPQKALLYLWERAT